MKLVLNKFKINGKTKAISTSKMRNTIVIKKNRKEKGKREGFKGSNPHSKGESFSWSSKVLWDKRVAKKFRIIDRATENTNKRKIK